MPDDFLSWLSCYALLVVLCMYHALAGPWYTTIGLDYLLSTHELLYTLLIVIQHSFICFNLKLTKINFQRFPFFPFLLALVYLHVTLLLFIMFFWYHTQKSINNNDYLVVVFPFHCKLCLLNCEWLTFPFLSSSSSYLFKSLLERVRACREGHITNWTILYDHPKGW